MQGEAYREFSAYGVRKQGIPEEDGLGVAWAIGVHDGKVPVTAQRYNRMYPAYWRRFARLRRIVNRW